MPRQQITDIDLSNISPTVAPITTEEAELFSRALSAMDAGQWTQAEQALSDGLRLSPQRRAWWFNRAWCRWHQGQASLAVEDLQAWLSEDPRDAASLALLGRIQLSEGQLQIGAATMSLAWRMAPEDAEIAQACLRAWLVVPGAEGEVLNLCRALAAKGLLSRADGAAVAEVLSLDPRWADALHQLWIDLCQGPREGVQTWMFQAWAASCAQRHQHAETAVAARLWLQHDPASIDALDLLIQALAARGDYDAALPLALQRVRLHPQDMEGMHALADLLYASMDTPTRMAAAQVLSHALQREPDNPVLWCLRGEINGRLFLKAQAAEDFQQALNLDPHHELAVCGLAGTLSQEGRFDDALALLEQHAGPDRSLWRAPVMNAVGNILRAAGRLEDAESVLRAGLSLTGNPVFAVNLAFTLLSQGRYLEGFAQFLRRRDTRRLARTWHQALALGAQPWEGDLAAVAGQSLLVTAENGLGDTFQFVRFVPALVNRGVRVTLAAQPRTAGLLRSVHPDVAVVEAEAPLPATQWVCDVHDLPGFLGADLRWPSSLGEAHCLRANPALGQKVAAHIRASSTQTGLRVALGWRGTRSSLAERSIDLARFAEVDWGVPITWFSLQHGELSPEDQSAAEALGMVCPSWSFDEAAAAMTLMDAVVSIDTVYAHLAGALGLAPMVLLNAIVDWRWETGDHSPWYPRAQLIRATALDDWSGVLDRLAVTLRACPVRSTDLLLAVPAPDAELETPAEQEGVSPSPPSSGQSERESEIRAALQQGRLEAAAEMLRNWLHSDDEQAGLWSAFHAVLPHLAHPGALAGALMVRLGRLASGSTAGTNHAVEAARAYGLMCLKARRHVEGLPPLQWAATQAPEDPWSWILLARIHHLANEGPACLKAAERAAARAPQDPAARAALFLGYMGTWRYDEAWGEVQRRRGELMATDQTDGEAMAENWGCEAAIWRGRGDIARAEDVLRGALAVKAIPELMGHLGELLAIQGRYAEAAPAMLALMAPKARMGDAIGRWLDQGAFEWQGPVEAVIGRRLVVEADNGAGDTFQFARLLPRLSQLGVDVTLRVSPSQLGVMRQLADGPADRAVKVMGMNEPAPPADAFIHLEPLPWALGVTLETLPDWGPAAYLRADPQRQRAQRERWGLDASDQRLKVGLAWLGQAVGGGVRRTDLATVARVFQAAGLLPHMRLFALPIEPLTPDETSAAQTLGLTCPAWSFEDEAAALTQLDLVITVDTSHAHLAGSLGVPCWVLLNHTPDWRWGLQGDTTPWYPSLRLFRQSRAGSWEEPLQAVAQALRDRLGL